MASQNLTFPSTLRSTLRRLKQATIGKSICVSNGALYDPFFIVGSGRCGTTLLRRILCSNPDIHIPPEFYIAELLRVYDKHCKLRWREYVYMALAYVAFKHDYYQYSFQPLAQRLIKLPKNERSLATIVASIAAYDAEQKGITYTRWGDKTPYNVVVMDEILEMYPDARFIHLYRDGCDVVASYMRLGHHDFVDAGRLWVKYLEQVEAFAHQDRVLPLRYEDLVSDPETHTRATCAFLDIPFLEDMIQINERAKSAMTEEADQAHHANVHTRVSTDQVGKGRGGIPRETLELLAPVMDPWLIKLGYKPCLES